MAIFPGIARKFIQSPTDLSHLDLLDPADMIGHRPRDSNLGELKVLKTAEPSSVTTTRYSKGADIRLWPPGGPGCISGKPRLFLFSMSLYFGFF
jgi:hypothetical protein